MTIKLEARDIGLSYFQPRSNTRLVALEAVSLTILEGEFVSVVGPSGCGKTTFLSIVDGLLRPTSGQIIVDGRLVTTPGPDRAVVFQDASLLPWRTVLGNVSYGLECQRRTGPEARERAQHFIEMVGLHCFEQHYPHELSGGMQQRVAIARALAAEPKLLLLDEPFGALDLQIRESMQEFLYQLWQRTGLAALLITHDLEEAMLLAQQVHILAPRPGRIVRSIALPSDRSNLAHLRVSPAFLELREDLARTLRSLDGALVS